MPKLPPLTPRKVIRILNKKGFVLARSRGSHQIYWNPQSRRQVTIPVHTTDLPQGTLLEILKQAGITRDEIGDLLWWFIGESCQVFVTSVRMNRDRFALSCRIDVIVIACHPCHMSYPEPEIRISEKIREMIPPFILIISGFPETDGTTSFCNPRNWWVIVRCHLLQKDGWSIPCKVNRARETKRR